MLTTEEFWELNAGLPPEDAAGLLAEQLAKLDPERVRAYQHHFDAVIDDAYRCPLWAAAYLIGGGCSDDAFIDFRSGLISRGRAVFDAALAEPDSLAGELPADDPEGGHFDNEEFGYVAREVYEDLTGGEMPDEPLDGFPRRDFPADPTGDVWEFDDAAEQSARFPRLWKHFGW